ncbi:MAG: MaoC family dehydratase N-terminal domain-containing protein [Propionibacteriaceae bacterium]|jgi:acyl dehydratase|nr:MaoC family dehydratase N-terminal domain-containing protein [Propionibacteriaceae bacterium]
MPISAEHAGRAYPATEPLAVTAAGIAAFARALGDDNPAYAGPEPVAPPTFAVVLAQRAWQQLFDDPELGLSLDGTIHADQRFAWSRPLSAGESVRARARIEKVRLRPPTALVTVAVDIATSDGEAVCQSVSTLMTRVAP